ncbi:MAG: hypothetical protein V7641_3709 [Blastocatellia bacterium]
MKTRIRLIVAALLVAGLMPFAGLAQGTRKTSSRRAHKKPPAVVQAHAYRARGIKYETEVQHVYDSGMADGVKVAVFKYKNGDWTGVSEGETFTAGDKVRLQFVSNFDGHVYILNVRPNGGKRVLFPYPGKGSNLVSSGATYIWPEIGAWVFDNEPGKEVLQVILSKDPVAIYDEAVKRPNGDLEESAANAAAQLASGGQKKKDNGFIAQDTTLSELPGYHARTLKYVAGKKKNETVAVISNPESTVTPGKLDTNQVAALQIQLDHREKK